jgi:SAM-dependent methyltransferase
MRRELGDRGPERGEARTVEHFGFEWTRFDQSALPEQELRAIFAQYFALFPWDSLEPNAIGLDLGCGTGRWARFAAERVGLLYCVDASEPALRTAASRLRDRPNCRFLLGRSAQLPIKDASLDFAYCLGVLHHTADPLAGLVNAVTKLRPSAPLLLYLYYALDHRPGWFRAIWRASDLVRRVVSRLPAIFRYAVTQLVALGVYWPLARTARVLEILGRDVDGFPLATYRHLSLYTMRTDALDRLGTPTERRFSAAEVRLMMDRAGLAEVVVSRHPPYWCALGRKPVE